MNVESDRKKSFKQQFKKRCFLFSIEILKSAEILRTERRNWILIDQLVRAATSIGANVVEGGSSISKKEFISYFQIALKSSSETLYWLALLQEVNPQKKDALAILIAECTELKKLITTIVLNTKTNSRF